MERRLFYAGEARNITSYLISKVIDFTDIKDWTVATQYALGVLPKDTILKRVILSPVEDITAGITVSLGARNVSVAGAVTYGTELLKTVAIPAYTKGIQIISSTELKLLSRGEMDLFFSLSAQPLKGSFLLVIETGEIGREVNFLLDDVKLIGN